MTNFFSKIWNEVKLQLSDTPSWVPHTMKHPLSPLPHVDSVCKQLEKAVSDPNKKMIFLISPRGAGKTNIIQEFLNRNPKIPYVYKSFIKIKDLEFAFLHLTSFLGRQFFIVTSIFLTFLLVHFAPSIGCLPLLLAVAYFFSKNSANLIYIFYKSFQDLFIGKPILTIIEDLEKSPLSNKDHWALLANLWQNNCTYIVSLGYPPEEKHEKLNILEFAMKLNGVIIEVPVTEESNMVVMREYDKDSAFSFPKGKYSQMSGWLSLFTPRELLLVNEQIKLRLNAWDQPHTKDNLKKLISIDTYLDLLARKIGLNNKEIYFKINARELRGIQLLTLPEHKKHYINSFIASIDSKIGIKLNSTLLKDLSEENPAGSQVSMSADQYIALMHKEEIINEEIVKMP